MKFAVRVHLFVGIAMIAPLHVSTSDDRVCYLHKRDDWPEDCRYYISALREQGERFKVVHNGSTLVQNKIHGTIKSVIFSEECICTCNCACEQKSESNQDASETSTTLTKDGCYQFIYGLANKSSCCINKTDKPASPEANYGKNNTSTPTSTIQSSSDLPDSIYVFFHNNWVLLLCLFFPPCAVCAFVVLAQKFFEWKRLSNRLISIERNAVDLAIDNPSFMNATSIKKESIILMYANDCNSFKTTVNLLYQILRSALKCNIYDLNQDEYLGEIFEDGDNWLKSKLNECDKVVIISSEAALALESKDTTHIDKNSLTRLQKHFFSEYLHNVHSKGIYVRFENFSPTSFPALLTPSSMYTIPSRLGDLLDALDLCSKSHQNFSMWEQQLRDSIQALSEYKAMNPQYLLNILK